MQAIRLYRRGKGPWQHLQSRTGRPPDAPVREDRGTEPGRKPRFAPEVPATAPYLFSSLARRGM